MTTIFEYKCPECKHQGKITDLFCDRLCPECKTDVRMTIARRDLEFDAVNQTNRRMLVVSGYFSLFNERSVLNG